MKIIIIGLGIQGKKRVDAIKNKKELFATVDYLNKDADYKYRSYIDREVVANAISEELLNINYDNFKSSVSKDDGIRSNAYMKVWMALNQIQS